MANTVRITLHAPTDRHGPSSPFEHRRHAETVLNELLDHPPGLELTSSCTHGLESAARLLGIGPGDEVVVPAFTFPSTANAFLAVGATIRFADVDLATANIDPDSVEAAIGSRTAAVVTLHYGGVASDVYRLGELCDATGAFLVEDAAHSLFARLDGRPLGRFGRIAAFSFHRTKNISAVEGGALVLNDADLVAPAQILLDKGTNRVEFESGLTDSYEWSGFGSAWRMASPMIELLVGQLDLAATIQSRRTRIWDRYHQGLSEWGDAIGAALPSVPPGAAHPAHLFWIRLPDGTDRRDFVEHCDTHGVDAARHYGSLPESRYGRRIADPRDRCPNAEMLSNGLVRIPLHHALTDVDVDRVLDVVTSWRPTAPGTRPRSC